MKKLFIPCFIVALVIAALAGWDMYRASRAEVARYRADVAAKEADNALKAEALRKADETIRVARVSEAVALEDAAKAKRETATARAALTTLQAQEPPTTPEVEALPIVVNLRGQVARLTEMFNLSQSENAAQARAIVSKDTIIAAQAEAIVALTAQRDNYEALWRTADGMVTKTYRSSRIWAAVGKYGPPVAFVAGMLLSK